MGLEDFATGGGASDGPAGLSESADPVGSAGAGAGPSFAPVGLSQGDEQTGPALAGDRSSSESVDNGDVIRNGVTSSILEWPSGQ